MKNLSKVKIIIPLLGLLFFLGTNKPASAIAACTEGSTGYSIYYPGSMAAGSSCTVTLLSCTGGVWVATASLVGTSYGTGCEAFAVKGGTIGGATAQPLSGVFGSIQKYFVSMFPGSATAAAGATQ